MKKLLILLPILVIASYTAGCIFSDDDKPSSGGSNAIIGTWEDWVTVFGDRQRDTITFNKDGTFNFGTDYYDANGYVETDKIYGTYTISGSIVTLTYREMGKEWVDTYTFSISGNTLTLTNAYEGTVIQYTKA